MKNIFLILTILAAAFGIGGCANDPDGVLEFRDSRGNIVASGTLDIPDELPPVGQHFEGMWELHSSNTSFPSNASHSGTYSGYVYDSGVSCDLNPQVADNNIVVSGSISSNTFAGKWFHATDAGDQEMGNFTVTWPTKSAP